MEGKRICLKWQVGLEGYNMGEPIDLVKLDGTWRLQYTSAPDVLVLFEAAARLPFFKVYTNQQMLLLILPLSFLFNLCLL